MKTSIPQSLVEVSRPYVHSFSQEPCAYLNLLDPRVRYPLDPENVGGALKVLNLMLPHHKASVDRDLGL